MRTLRNTLTILAFVATACATGDQPKMKKPPDEFRLADGTLVVCRMESETGSHIRERVCRKVEGTTPSQQQGIDAILNKPATNTRVGN